MHSEAFAFRSSYREPFGDYFHRGTQKINVGACNRGQYCPSAARTLQGRNWVDSAPRSVARKDVPVHRWQGHPPTSCMPKRRRLIVFSPLTQEAVISHCLRVVERKMLRMSQASQAQMESPFIGSSSSAKHHFCAPLRYCGCLPILLPLLAGFLTRSLCPKQ